MLICFGSKRFRGIYSPLVQNANQQTSSSVKRTIKFNVKFTIVKTLFNLCKHCNQSLATASPWRFRSRHHLTHLYSSCSYGKINLNVKYLESFVKGKYKRLEISKVTREGQEACFKISYWPGQWFFKKISRIEKTDGVRLRHGRHLSYSFSLSDFVRTLCWVSTSSASKCNRINKEIVLD